MESWLAPTPHSRLLATVAEIPRGLGKFRNADVLAARAASFAHPAGARLLRAAALEPRGRRKAVRRAVGRAQAARDRIAIDGSLDEAPPTDPLLLPLARTGYWMLRAASDSATRAEMHCCRLEMKTLRDACEDLAAAGLAPGADALAAEVRAASDALGRITDADLLRAVADAAPGQPGAAALRAAARGEGAAAIAEFRVNLERRRWPRLAEVLRAARRAA